MKIEEQLVLISWALAGAHHVPSRKSEIKNIADTFITDGTLRGSVQGMLDAIPAAEDGDDIGSFQACAHGMIEFCHQVDTQEEFDVLADLEYDLFKEYCRLGELDPLSREEHNKDLYQAVARDFLMDRANRFGGNLEGMAAIVFKAAVSEEIAKRIPEIAELVESGEFIKQRYAERQFIFDGTTVKLDVPEEEEDKDEWLEEFDDEENDNIL